MVMLLLQWRTSRMLYEWYARLIHTNMSNSLTTCSRPLLEEAKALFVVAETATETRLSFRTTKHPCFLLLSLLLLLQALRLYQQLKVLRQHRLYNQQLVHQYRSHHLGSHIDPLYWLMSMPALTLILSGLGDRLAAPRALR